MPLRCFLLTLAMSALACTQQVERVPPPFQPSTAHEAYAQSLIDSQLAHTALGRDWIHAAGESLVDPIKVESPFRETGYFDASQPTAIAYMFSVRGGQRIAAEVKLEASQPLRVFMDLYRLVAGDPAAPVHVASGATASNAVPDGTLQGTGDGRPPNPSRLLGFEPLRDAVYVLRVQPELLRGARYTLVIRADASLDFPVAGRDTGAIQSNFGAERDAGRRSHRGVDIFAPRGTPVLAASDGVVTRASTTQVGGNVVWMSTENRRLRLYYAHLDSHSVVPGQRVRAGDQLGTVGNTGNARTTPTHLHFGVYARGAADPDPFLRRVRVTPVDLTVDVDRLGAWSRATRPSVNVLADPDRRSEIVTVIDEHTPFRVWGASARWYRVDLPDGTRGYVAGQDTERATPLRSAAIADGSHVFDRPTLPAAVIDQLSPGVEVPVLGLYGEFLYVETPSGLTGWLPFE